MTNRETGSSYDVSFFSFYSLLPLPSSFFLSFSHSLPPFVSLPSHMPQDTPSDTACAQHDQMFSSPEPLGVGTSAIRDIPQWNSN